MVTVVFAFALFAIILVMATLGAVLLVRFALGGQGHHSRRVFAAALGGPVSILVPTIVFVITEQGIFPAEQVVGFGFILLLAFAVIGWPVAHFATRRLDRLTRFDLQVFD